MPILLATLAAIISATAFKFLTGNNIVAGVLATWVDNVVFYGYISFQDLKKKRRKRGLSLGTLFRHMRNMFVEFGPAEYLDSFLLRPFYLSSFPYVIGNYPLAILLGSVAAEVTFFIPVIIFYELRKKVFKD